jgi:TRAP-type mannitol/chloroaromatic compound transport system permease small subunit
MSERKNIVEQGIEQIGRFVCYFILIVTFIIAYEVVARYAFNAPTNWAWPINKQIFGLYVLFSGGYALIHKTHIRIEVFYQYFSPTVKRVIHWFTFGAALTFLGSLLWKSTLMGIEAWETKEKAVGVFRLHLYPLKMMIPVGALVFILACFAVYLKSNTNNPEDSE